MVIEGVLRMPDSDGHYPTGWNLYQAIASTSRLHLLSHTWPEEELETWLMKRRLTGHLGILAATADTPQARIDALERVRDWRLDLVIEPDPVCAAAELEAGFNVLLHTHAQFSRPSWRPDYDRTPRPWDQLTAAIDKQNLLRLQQHTKKKDPT
jgi:hypothetical protein